MLGIPRDIPWEDGYFRRGMCLSVGPPDPTGAHRTRVISWVFTKSLWSTVDSCGVHHGTPWDTMVYYGFPWALVGISRGNW